MKLSNFIVQNFFNFDYIPRNLLIILLQCRPLKKSQFPPLSIFTLLSSSDFSIGNIKDNQIMKRTVQHYQYPIHFWILRNIEKLYDLCLIVQRLHSNYSIALHSPSDTVFHEKTKVPLTIADIVHWSISVVAVLAFDFRETNK